MTETESSRGYCRKCLLKDMPEEAYFKSLYEYIAHLDKDIKAEPKEYKRRLDLCQTCENLLNGMCRICGCFVELRAVVEKNYCPHSDKYW
ncbi:hypothetical protein acsn021_43370 [Anaerocolumna cellulosilytica]|uniref:Uncharacterized protein n=1 Tax=Anaerocolumna cellulosilytica TaxID=433286 RepID=A0A6S6RD91_9FIRM|nr:DUF6171 family protein [Anaerocolumna cellulosilytica]MBB5195295.1 hypothetical protein [Anaerocolumna cellulosilytica]BCJ96768.1 hypothetical protein acsn021_43370 [Anaerocolumna cellulosilytica]